ncbi:MAG: S-methyl-5-thioribose-1-phosphate isomerase [Deltaproteobacteria bacterium]|nr:S-methyl-5-thioribose-1-phosphate isomerase [Deltaproteobacteria bacterium]
MSRRHIEWDESELRLLDQRLLPREETYVACADADSAARAITDMVVRGAPAIGVTAAYGLALEAARTLGEGGSGEEAFRAAAARMREARPTAVNLMWAVDRMLRVLERGGGDVVAALRAEAEAIDAEDLQMCKDIGRHGGALLPEEGTVLTHCNAGGLATAGYGTALGVIRGGLEQGKRLKVFADETRPYLQGARLTAYELHQDGIDVTVIPDVAAGHLMSKGLVQAVVVGSDRIAANGDVANKIGTYQVAVLAHRHGIPFYVAAPTSTVDLETATGEGIPIEERSEEEVTHLVGVQLAPTGVKARNPAFDVTPAELVTAIITEQGVARAPYGPALAGMVAAASAD